MQFVGQLGRSALSQFWDLSTLVFSVQFIPKPLASSLQSHGVWCCIVTSAVVALQELVPQNVTACDLPGQAVLLLRC